MGKEENKIPRTNLTFAIILRTDVEDIQKIQEYLSGLDDLQVIYQKCSADKLYIIEEEN